MVHGSISSEDKNSTSEGGGKDREVEVPRSPKMVGPWLLHSLLTLKYSDLARMPVQNFMFSLLNIVTCL
jgi:hypothetical protein